MALFSKPPVKKTAVKMPPDPPPPRQGGRPASARELTERASLRGGTSHAVPSEPTGDITITGSSLIEWTQSAPMSIEVGQANPGLCAVLENAALLFASGQVAAARALLDQGVQTDHDAKLSPLAWLALFDLLQRADDRAAYEQLALQYVVQFERSAPVWDETGKPASSPKSGAGGFIALTGKLSTATANQFDGLRKAIEKRVPAAKLDLGSISQFDDGGARALADLLALARKRQMRIAIQRAEKLVAALNAAVKKGTEGGEGAWLLLLELMQWRHDRAAFEDRALEYAIAFELSPPSLEPGLAPQPEPMAKDDAAGNGALDVATISPMPEGEELVWTGVMCGTVVPYLAKLMEFAQGRPVVPINMAGVERVDFVCAGTLLNAINRIEMQRKSVQIAGATPIVRALLLLIGISPRHFVRKNA